MNSFKKLSGIAISLLIAIVAAGAYQRAEGNGAAVATPPQTRHVLVPSNSTLAPINAGTQHLKSVRGPGYLASPGYTRVWRDDILASLNDIETQANIKALMAGQPTTEHPAVGLLLEVPPGQLPIPRCTGTLVDSETFLTAAHCVLKERPNSRYLVYFQHAGVVAVLEDGITRYCDDHVC